ncbi:ABC transporter ATP-binding protein [Lachnoanaerobaculum sp. Marseille-Q4761]|uniref:ABC transporter ATP-binding protein n=1 Tax=Lachnoanaerobaculum sp. Marseille-Q4761 TaxID=2819511 RepID=UPI000F184ED5|nr:ABC transporter ATP-binding protein [Lachnoanaerobaculum sp. Marseille-Q4761]MBO1871621.1 ABC transporter ATP-binding protein [Lachnoanaerobaculum sp. Marseille-Q4761]RKW36712.1 MAG: ABC transporter ATP-binding protein [Lachnospiraceae bacterium]
MLRLVRYLKDYKKESVLAPLFKFLEAAFELLVPLVIAKIIDVGIANKDSDYIIKMGILLVSLAVIGLSSAIVAQYFSAKAATGFGTKLRDDLFAHILSFSHAETDILGRDTLVTRVTNDSDQVQNGVNRFFRLVLRSPFIVAGAFIMSFNIDAKMSIIAFTVIVILAIIVSVIMSKSIGLYRNVQRKLDKVLGKTGENLSGIRVIRAFSKEESEVSEYNDATKDLYNDQVMVGNISALLNPLTYVVVNLGIVAILQAGAIQVNIGNLSTGQVVALINYMSQILVELVKLANLIILLAKASACAKRINEIFDIKSSIKGGKLKLEINNFEGDIISFEDVGFAYPKSKQEALSDISFCIKKGETIGIIGGTGSGKSSLINLIPRFYDISRGKIKLAGKDIKEYSIESIRENIALVEQKSRLFRGDIKSNLLWGDNNASEQELYEAATIAQAVDVINSKENKLNSEVAMYGNNFSGGQKQRLSIARSLVKKAGILILDDSSSALDYATDSRLRKAIKQIKNITTLIVSQRIVSIKNADRIIVLDDGKIVGIGTHDELLESNSIYREIYNSQIMSEEDSNEK